MDEAEQSDSRRRKAERVDHSSHIELEGSLLAVLEFLESTRGHKKTSHVDVH